jgi:hypothetical protein
MRFVFTLGLPSYKGNLVQQIIGDHPADSLDNLWDELNNVDFIRVDQFYHVIHRNGDKEWQYKGPMLVSTNHIGKVQEFVAREEEAY